MPLRRSGHGKSACTMRASTSVVGPSSMSTGSCQLPTASAGEWVVLDTIPRGRSSSHEADHARYTKLGLLGFGEKVGSSTQLHPL